MCPGRNAQYLILFFLVLCLPCLYYCFTFDCASCVRLPCVTIILPKKVLKEAWQNRHLEQGEDYFCNRNGHVDDGHLTLHQW